MHEHDAKTNLLPADGEAYGLLLRSSVSLIGGTV